MYDSERKNSVYKIENLDYHIMEFVKLQSKDTTRYNYSYVLNKFCKYCYDNNIYELRKDNMKSIVLKYKSYLLNKQNLASTSIDNYILRVQSFLSYLNLPVKIKKLNSNKTKNYKYLTFNEIKLLINSIPGITDKEILITRNKAIILSFFTAGLRVSELCNLKIDDYCTKDNINYFLVRGKGRASDEREWIAIPGTTSIAIDEYLKLAKNNEYLFTSFNGNQLSRQAIDSMLNKLSEYVDSVTGTNLSSRVSSHSFRHSLARYLLVDKNVPISQVKDVLRHANIETTAQYLRNSDEEIRNLRTNILEF